MDKPSLWTSQAHSHLYWDKGIGNDLQFIYMNTKDNIADMITKALDVATFKRLKEMLGVERVTA